MPSGSGNHHRGLQPVAAPLPATLAQLTDAVFLDVIYRDGASSRARIAKLTGISRPTISEAAQRLLAEALIVEVGQTATGMRGRSAVLYDLNPNRGHTVGVALERGYVAVKALDPKGDVLAQQQVDERNEDLHNAIADARMLVRQCSMKAGTTRLATALSVAAPIDPTSHTIRQLADAPFIGTVRDFAAALDIPPTEPFVVDNDVNWATIAESRIGSMQSEDNFLYVYVGAGVGAGLFLGGELRRGSTGTAGEIAFVRLPAGNTLMRRLGQSMIGTPDGRSIDVDKARAQLDSESPVPGVDDLVNELARTIVNVATAVDPRCIVLGGPLANTRQISGRLRSIVETTAISGLTVAVSPLGRTAPLEGTAIGALELSRRQHAAPSLTPDAVTNKTT
jgi:predicted NBD/HSP70 family sugar kinase